MYALNPAGGKGDVLHDELVDAELSERMWQRLKDLVPEVVVVDESGDDIGLPGSEPVLHGTWRACGVNPFFRIVRYAGNGIGHFGPHRDGAFEKSLGEHGDKLPAARRAELVAGFEWLSPEQPPCCV